MSDDKPSVPLVFVPKGAKTNEENVPMNPPEVVYENRKKNIDLDIVKLITKGKYGRTDK